MAIPKWLNGFLQKSELDQIEEAVRKAETTTSGEVVPMVVRRSSTVGHVPVILLLSISLFFFMLDLDHLQLEWLPVPYWLALVIDFVVISLLVRLLSPLAFIERLLTSKEDQAFQVEQRAINEFYNHQVDQTKHSTGILIFVSLMEHRAVVLGDKSISDKIDQETWQKVINRLIEDIKQKNLASGFIDAIDMSAEILTKHFPIKPDDKNELKNHLIIKE